MLHTSNERALLTQNEHDLVVAECDEASKLQGLAELTVEELEQHKANTIAQRATVEAVMEQLKTAFNKERYDWTAVKECSQIENHKHV